MGTESTDRTVHAATDDGREIVRYDRSGKWYVEQDGGLTRRRLHVPVAEAARLACRPGSTVRTGLPGGGLFDRMVRGAA